MNEYGVTWLLIGGGQSVFHHRSPVCGVVRERDGEVLGRPVMKISIVAVLQVDSSEQVDAAVVNGDVGAGTCTNPVVSII